MTDTPIHIDEAYVCDIARDRLVEIQKLIQIAKRQGQPSNNLLLADHLIAMSVLAFEEMAARNDIRARR